MKDAIRLDAFSHTDFNGKSIAGQIKEGWICFCNEL